MRAVAPPSIIINRDRAHTYCLLKVVHTTRPDLARRLNESESSLAPTTWSYVTSSPIQYQQNEMSTILSLCHGSAMGVGGRRGECKLKTRQSGG